jgi:hypothetical protein
MPSGSRTGEEKRAQRRDRDEPERDEPHGQDTASSDEPGQDDQGFDGQRGQGDPGSAGQDHDGRDSDEEPEHEDGLDDRADDAGHRPEAKAGRRGGASPQRREREALPANQAARTGLRHVAELTGKPTTGVTSLGRTEHGWTVGIEVVEDARIPSSGDILAEYQAEVGAAGELLGYRRIRRYPRGRGDSGVS